MTLTAVVTARHHTVYYFGDLDLNAEILFEKEHQEKGMLILKKGIETPVYSCVRFEEIFMQSLPAFLLSFW